MAKRKRKARQRRERGLNASMVEQRLLASSFPRLQMVLLLSLSALGTFFSSASLLALDLRSMGIRYALAVLGGYALFLSLVRVWIAYQTRNWRFGREPRQEQTRAKGEQRPSDSSVDIPDLSALADLGGSAEGGFSGAGGAFGGAGASGDFGFAEASSAASASTESSAGSVLDGVGSADEGLPIVIAIIALLGGLIALGFVVYSSPMLFAEVLLDVAVAGALYKRNKRHERGHWAAGVLRRTYKPVLVLAVFAAIFGFAVQSSAPTEKTLGAVLKAHDAQTKAHGE
jgi:hypothetical protein